MTLDLDPKVGELKAGAPLPVDVGLAGRIALAIASVGAFSADGFNQEKSYRYISADQVLARGGAALAQQGVVVVPSVVESIMTVVDRGPSKAPRMDAHVKLQMVITDGSSSIVAQWSGWGADFSAPDKALYKAITSGHKYFLMKLLCIGVGEEGSEHESGGGDQEEEERPARSSQPSAPKAPMSIEQARVIQITTTNGPRLMGDLTTSQLEAVVSNAKFPAWVEAATVLLAAQRQQQDAASSAGGVG